jgi:MarR family transcriptional regulator, transcriptional regulator for hemolysin
VIDKSIENLLRTGDLSGITTYQAAATQSNAHRLLQKYSDDILKPYGITKVQWTIIGLSLDSGDKGARVTDLAKRMGVTMAFLTNTINVLELKNILERVENAGDSRSRLVRVNAQFKPQCAEIEQTLRGSLRKTIYKDIAVEDFHTYMKVLYQLENISKKSD